MTRSLAVRVILAAVVVGLGLLLVRQLSGMDPRFVRLSPSGARGLVLYLAGFNREAADAYREHDRNLAEADATPADPAWNALLRGDRRRAQELSEGCCPGSAWPLLALHVLFLARHVLGKAPADDGVASALVTVDQISRLAILGFGLYGLFLVLNARLDIYPLRRSPLPDPGNLRRRDRARRAHPLYLGRSHVVAAPGRGRAAAAPRPRAARALGRAAGDRASPARVFQLSLGVGHQLRRRDEVPRPAPGGARGLARAAGADRLLPEAPALERRHPVRSWSTCASIRTTTSWRSGPRQG